LRHITDPGVGKAIAVGALLLAVLGFGLWLMLRGMN
jgi:hypothetical protein